LNKTSKEKETKAKIDKLDYIKLKLFCMAKERMNRVKMQPNIGRRYLQIKTFDKGLIFRVYKELKK
jgi:hypothetical protein